MRRLCLGVIALPLLVCAESPPLLSEKDFLTEFPVVMSVSRLPQPIDETPGSVTIIDRDLIRLSGARNIVDLFRLVPGFQVSDSVEGSAPLIAYHGGFSENSNRMQVLVDGRSVYSTFRFGQVAQGLQSLALQDIERIEVIRGSDSAAYGARAVLGVVNIVTLDPLATHGVIVAAAIGDNGIADRSVRVGGGNETGNYRLTAESRGDDGLSGANGTNRVRNINLRADLRLDAASELQFRAGSSEQFSGLGHADNPLNAERELRATTNYVQVDWRRDIGPESDLAASFSHTANFERNNFFVALPVPFVGTTVDFGGKARSDALVVQHTFSPGTGFRFVWGGELRREEVFSFPLYNKDSLSNNFRRLFGNLEWRIAPSLLLNAGTMLERSSLSGSDSAPRVMLNWHAARGQTFRIGVSDGHRPPSFFEKDANVRYVINGALFEETFVARGQAQAEHLRAREIGYLGDFPALDASVDVRVFDEKIDGLILPQRYDLPANTKLLDPQTAVDFVNGEGFSLRGIEFSARLKLGSGTRLLFNESLIHNDTHTSIIATAAPSHSSALLLLHRFSSGLDLSLGHYRSGPMAWQGAANLLAATHRTDLRVGMPFRVGTTRCEAALTVQNLGEPYNDFLPTFQFRRQAFASMTVQF